jgi:hypothetical protein
VYGNCRRLRVLFFTSPGLMGTRLQTRSDVEKGDAYQGGIREAPPLRLKVGFY